MKKVYHRRRKQHENDVTRYNLRVVGVLFFDDVSVFLAGREAGKETGKEVGGIRNSNKSIT